MNIEWMDQAMCRDYSTSLFYNEEAVATAKTICRQCPVLAECDQWATETEEPHGVWGAQLRNGRARTAVPCGTEAGAQTHRRRRERVCGACERAEHVARRERGSRGSA